MNGLDVLGRKHHQRLIGHAGAIAPHRGQSARDGLQDAARGARLVFADAVRRLAGIKRDRALIWLEASIHVQRFPRILLFILRDAIGELARIAERGHIDPVRTRAAEIQENQLQRAAQRAVGARDVAEDVLPATEIQLAGEPAR